MVSALISLLDLAAKMEYDVDDVSLGAPTLLQPSLVALVVPGAGDKSRPTVAPWLDVTSQLNR